MNKLIISIYLNEIRESSLIYNILYIYIILFMKQIINYFNIYMSFFH